MVSLWLPGPPRLHLSGFIPVKTVQRLAPPLKSFSDELLGSIYSQGYVIYCLPQLLSPCSFKLMVTIVRSPLTCPSQLRLCLGRELAYRLGAEIRHTPHRVPLLSHNAYFGSGHAPSHAAPTPCRWYQRRRKVIGIPVSTHRQCRS